MKEKLEHQINDGIFKYNNWDKGWELGQDQILKKDAKVIGLNHIVTHGPKLKSRNNLKVEKKKQKVVK